jgi:Putative peptidoglycan binding domain/CHAP domain
MPAVPAKITSKAVLDKARSQLGVHEVPYGSNKTPYTVWYGMTGPWCAMFVSWCLAMAGNPIPITTAKGYAYCPYGVDFYKKKGAWAGVGTRPKPGWVVFFNFPGDNVNRVSHTGLVEGIASDGRIICLEGNTNGAGGRTGGMVMRHHRRSGIVGYGMIAYKGGSAAPAPTPAPGKRTLKQGMRGADVKEWQKFLQDMKLLPAGNLDGVFGPKTADATKKWQRQLKIADDGIVGPGTRKATDDLFKYLLATNKNQSRPTIKQGSRGGDVTYLQSKLGIKQDGVFGPATKRAVINFQRRKKLNADGIVGPKTWRALG